MKTHAVINIAKVQLGLDDDTYRALLVRVTGKSSLRAMTERERIAVVDEMKRRGFRVVTKSGRKLPAATKPYIRLIHALWASCARLGVIEDGSRPALRTFVANEMFRRDQTAVSDPDFLTFDQATPIIETLKAMERRGKNSCAAAEAGRRC